MNKVIDCAAFRDSLEHLLADELPAPERQLLQRHTDACRECAAVLEFESGMRRAVADRLRRIPAPPGLETRIRASLDAATPARSPAAWFRRPAFSALAASLLLAVLVVAGNGRPAYEAGPGAATHVARQRVTVVDRDCERAGRTLSEQRKCRNHQHLNMLRVARGNYWFVTLDGAAGRQILLDPDLRGRRLIVEGELYPEIRTLRLNDYSVEAGAFSPDPVSL